MSWGTCIMRPTSRRSADREGPGWGPGGSGERERWSGDERFVDAVVRAGGGELLEIEHLAEQQTHIHDGGDMQRLEAVDELVRPELDAPGVRPDGGDFVLGQPRDRVEAEARSVTAGVCAPSLFPALGHLPGAHEQYVAVPDLDFPRLGGGCEILDRDRIPILQPVPPFGPRDVEEHGAAHQPVLEMLSTKSRR